MFPKPFSCQNGHYNLPPTKKWALKTEENHRVASRKLPAFRLMSKTKQGKTKQKRNKTRQHRTSSWASSSYVHGIGHTPVCKGESASPTHDGHPLRELLAMNSKPRKHVFSRTIFKKRAGRRKNRQESSGKFLHLPLRIIRKHDILPGHIQEAGGWTQRSQEIYGESSPPCPTLRRQTPPHSESGRSFLRESAGNGGRWEEMTLHSPLSSIVRPY